jgi:hypothetical protein
MQWPKVEAFKFLAGQYQGKRTLGRHTRGRGDIIKMVVTEVVCENVV